MNIIPFSRSGGARNLSQASHPPRSSQKRSPSGDLYASIEQIKTLATMYRETQRECVNAIFIMSASYLSNLWKNSYKDSFPFDNNTFITTSVGLISLAAFGTFIYLYPNFQEKYLKKEGANSYLERARFSKNTSWLASSVHIFCLPMASIFVNIGRDYKILETAQLTAYAFSTWVLMPRYIKNQDDKQFIRHRQLKEKLDLAFEDISFSGRRNKFSGLIQIDAEKDYISISMEKNKGKILRDKLFFPEEMFFNIITNFLMDEFEDAQIFYYQTNICIRLNKNGFFHREFNFTKLGNIIEETQETILGLRKIFAELNIENLRIQMEGQDLFLIIPSKEHRTQRQEDSLQDPEDCGLIVQQENRIRLKKDRLDDLDNYIQQLRAEEELDYKINENESHRMAVKPSVQKQVVQSYQENNTHIDVTTTPLTSGSKSGTSLLALDVPRFIWGARSIQIVDFKRFGKFNSSLISEDAPMTVIRKISSDNPADSRRLEHYYAKVSEDLAEELSSYSDPKYRNFFRSTTLKYASARKGANGIILPAHPEQSTNKGPAFAKIKLLHEDIQIVATKAYRVRLESGKFAILLIFTELANHANYSTFKGKRAQTPEL